jgi:DNA end-binding protein Ku
VTFEGRELTVAKSLIESLSVDWEPERYHNTYRDRIDELIEAKREGKAVIAKSEKPKTNVVDLMAALEASVARTAKSDGGASSAKTADDEAADTDLDTLSKAELSALATQYNVSGRSAMTKPQLIAALRKAGAGTAAGSRATAASA